MKRLFLCMVVFLCVLSVAGATNIKDRMKFEGPVTITGTLTTSGEVTQSGNIVLDDGTGASPSLTFTDGTDETAVLQKSDAGFLGITTVAGDGLNVLTGNLKVGNGTPGTTLDGEDVYIEGTLEVDGAIRFDGQLSTTSPKITTSILDANGGNMFTFSPMATPVNYWNFINGSTGVIPSINMTGETNVGLSVNLKGTGTLNVQTQVATDDTLVLKPYVGGAAYFSGTITSADLTTPSKVWTFPDLTGTVALTTNDLSIFAATTSSQLLGVLSDETGTGAAVFATSPTLVTPLLGTPTSGVLTNCTGLPSDGLTAGAKTHSVVIQVADPGGADADFAAGYVLWRPSVAVTITKVYLVPGLAYIAAAAANDALVTVTNAAVGNVCSLAIVTNLAAGSLNDMGAITNASVVANTDVTIAVTCNGTADAPVQNILIEYTTVN